jgi:sortase (surface protein transpeptidase)
VEARRFQEQEGRLLDRLLIEKRPIALRISAPNSALSANVRVAVGRGGLIGRMDIPRLGLSAMVIEGSDPATLRRAMGHIPGTPLPGIPGNTAITAHRDTFFRPLRNVRQDDMIRLTTLEGAYLYALSPRVS